MALSLLLLVVVFFARGAERETRAGQKKDTGERSLGHMRSRVFFKDVSQEGIIRRLGVIFFLEEG